LASSARAAVVEVELRDEEALEGEEEEEERVDVVAVAVEVSNWGWGVEGWRRHGRRGEWKEGWDAIDGTLMWNIELGAGLDDGLPP